jgi:hypothetical protein
MFFTPKMRLARTLRTDSASRVLFKQRGTTLVTSTASYWHSVLTPRLRAVGNASLLVRSTQMDTRSR